VRRAFSIIARLASDDRWSNWGWAILGHLAYGAVCGVLMLLPLSVARGNPEWFPFILTAHDVAIIVCLPLASIALLALAMTYQWAGYVRKHDTLRRDVRDYVIGFGFGLGASAIYAIVSWPPT